MQEISIQEDVMKSTGTVFILLSLGILGSANDLDGWRRPGENEAVNRHDFETCLAEASAVAAAEPHKPGLSDDDLPFGNNPESYFAAGPSVTSDPAGPFLSSTAEVRWRSCLEANGFKRSQPIK